MMSSTSPVAPLDPVLVQVLEDAASWRLLGRLFECPSDAWRADVAALSSEATEPELVAAASAALDEASEGLYHSMFGPGGPAPPREVSYHDSLELGSVMSSVTGYYQAFGYLPSLVESPDHVAVETGFLAFLAMKQAFAMMEGDGGHFEITARAAADFRTDHVAVYAERLAAILSQAPVSYLQLASTVLADRVGPRPGPKLLPVIQAPLDDDEFGCEA